MIVTFASAVGLASPGMAGALHLGSLPIEAGTAWAGSGALMLWTPGDAVGAFVLQAGAALGPRTAVDVQVGTDVWAGGFPVALAGRYVLHERDGLRVAATWTSLVVPLRDAYAYDFQVFTAHAPGIALDAGDERFRFDLAAPIWGLTSYDEYFGLAHFPLPLGATVGMNVAVGEHHRIRFGVPELLSWSWRTERAYFDLGGVTVVVAGALWSKFGVVF